MSRYPSTQFISIDNSAISNTVAINPTIADAPTYMYTFRSEKGPEDIRTVSGKEFYDVYGAQSKVLFDKYGQPLLQASMNINNGARVIAKRAVLDDAKLANITFGIAIGCIGSYSNLKTGKDITCNSDGNITSINYCLNNTNGKSPLTISPILYNTRDSFEYVTSSEETKDIYRLHKESITNDVTQLPNIPVTSTGLDGIVNGSKIVDGKLRDILTGPNAILTNTITGFGEQNYKYDSIFTESEKNNVSVSVEGNQGGSYLVIAPKTGVTPSALVDTDLVSVYNKLASLAVVVFPIFTIFDNGRGISTKSIRITFDLNSTRAVGKPIYKLTIVDDSTNAELETYYFCLNPYIRNTVNGFTYDIESQVNYKSNQINAVTHYSSYDSITTMLSEDHFDTITNMFSGVLDSYDCLFGHDIKGKNITNIIGELEIVTDRYYDYTATINVANPKTVSEYYQNPKNLISYINAKTSGIVSYKLNYGFDGVVKECKESTKVVEDVQEYNGINYFVTGQFSSVSTDPVVSTVGTSMEWRTISNTDTVLADGSVVNELIEGMLINREDGESEGDPAKLFYKIQKTTTTTTVDDMYQEQYYKFFLGKFDRNIYNLDIYFPNFIWDANYSPNTKIAIQRMAAIRGDLLAYMDMGINKVNSCESAIRLVNNTQDNSVIDELPLEYVENGIQYISDRHVAVTCLNMKIRDPYTNRVIDVTGTYNLSNTMIKFFINGAGRVFAGIGNGVAITNIIPESVNYVPKVYPTDNLRSLSQINSTYMSDDDSIINEPQQMCDHRINYASYYNNVLTIDTEYTLNPIDSEYSYINNVVLVNSLMQDIRKKCPQARFNFLDANGMEEYQKAVEAVIKDYKPKFAVLNFKYLEDENSIQNKIFYAAIEVSFRPFAQAEIFTITALNYSINSGNGISV